ncbi:MAG TPA: hypothetical protein VKT73_08555 [Xanthobacteraceae bacterium]|nr:hypothetical protein [Xanthobacteraceae bacterium]
MIDTARLFGTVPPPLREELLKTYKEIMSNYLQRRWEPSELNGGKFCEAVFSIIHGAVTGNFPAAVSKPPDMLGACRMLEKEPADPKRVGDRSLRVLIPRALPVLYEIRNNRGVGHVGGDVDANHMDAEFVQGTASWILAELVRIFHGASIDEAQTAVDALVERKTPAIWVVGQTKRVLDARMNAKDQVLMLLHHSEGWVSANDLFRWTEYSNESVFRAKVLSALHKDRLIEFDDEREAACISPRGGMDVERRLLKGSNLQRASK